MKNSAAQKISQDSGIISDELKNWTRSELEDLVRIPSISFAGFDPAEVARSAEQTAGLLKRAGFTNVEVLKIKNSHPYVVGEYIVHPDLPTVLLYAHHDVQPAGREEAWKTSPFEPTEINGRLYGRGTADDKAGILVHAAALKYYKDRGTEPAVNLKVIIEGEEESGSEHLLEFLTQYKERLKADTIIVTDTANIDCGVPSLTISLRGIVIYNLEVKSLRAPVHSGMWGGGVVDPAQVLVKMLSKLTDDSGKIQLKSISKKKRLEAKGIPVSRREFAEQAGVLKESSVPSNFFQRVFFEPSFSINAIQASSEKLANNIICDRAFARIGIRLTAQEKSKDVAKELEKKLKALAPKSVEFNLECLGKADAWQTDPKAKEHRHSFSAAEKALQEAFGKKAVYIGCGGSIPFIGPFEKALGASVVTLGVEDPYTLAHSENESLNLADFWKAIDAEILLFKYLGQK